MQVDKPGECPICGMSLEPQFDAPSSDEKTFEEPKLKWRFWLALFLTIPLIVIHLFPRGVGAYLSSEATVYIELLMTTIVVWVAGWPILRNALYSFQHKKLNIFSLVGSGILIAYVYSFLSVIFHATSFFQDELYFEPSAVITTLVLLGQWLESKVIHKTFSDIKLLTNSMPKLANLLLNNGEERKVALEDIKKGEHLRVKPNERIPTDGVVIEGQSWVNESIITGEIIPIYKHKGDPVLGGTLNGNGILVIEVERVKEDGILKEIIQTVTAARKTNSPIQKLGERLSQRMIPFVFLLAFGTAFIWLLLDYPLYKVICHAISVLIIASPSALALSATLPMVVGLGIGARHGIFIKNAASLETLEKIMTLVIDKTGTLTEGKPFLTKIYALYPFSETDVLKFGASIEVHCTHPVAQAIASGAKLKNIPLLKVADFQSICGKGVTAFLEGSQLFAGNRQYMEEMGVDIAQLIPQAEKWQKEGLTVIFVAFEKKGAGLLAVSDPVRFNAERIIQQLHQEKLRIVMATGDSKEAAFAVGRRLDVDQIEAEASPQKKMELVQALQAQGQKVAMAGDALNDDTAMSQADIGIALGAKSIKDLPQASIYLLKNSLQGVVRARLLSDATMKNIRENFSFAMLYNFLAVPIAAGLFGPLLASNLTPILAIIAMTLSNLFVVSNALRLQFINLRKD